MIRLKLLAAAAARALSWPVDAAAFRGEWRRDALALSIVLLLALGAWVIQECDRRRVLRALLIATVASSSPSSWAPSRWLRSACCEPRAPCRRGSGSSVR